MKDKTKDGMALSRRNFIKLGAVGTIAGTLSAAALPEKVRSVVISAMGV